MTSTTTLDVGDVFRAGPKTVVGSEMRTLVDLCDYSHPLFAGTESPPIIPGQLVLALAAGLIESSGRMGEDVVALLGLTDCRFRQAVVPGDELSVTATVTERRATSNGSVVLTLHQQITVAQATVADVTTSFLLAPPSDGGP